ncbi:hypothetical protein C8N46_10852 [Kordia periserrulae]|uniref:YhhN-like protein n=1 Tax=Kordia periserrulae TaxID=701523 RepID=A0A2T6BUK0_9FLAO|nr:hypothetical protein [Kordia periserrulae]PTX59742.1 hypothetical protein C8N46_10852 [Kordia periserrulae]
MKKIAKFLFIFLICIASIDFLWFFFPDYVSRKYAIVLTIPAITICYFLYEVKDYLYLLALGAFMFADYLFFIEKSLTNGMISSSVALAIYGIIVLKQSHYISTRLLLMSTVPFLILYLLPFYFFIDQIRDAIFGEVIFYTFAIGYFAFMSTMVYISYRNKVTQNLLLAGLSTGVMGVLFGIYLFIERKPIYAVIANSMFIFSHYKMWTYIILKDTNKDEDEE